MKAYSGRAEIKQLPYLKPEYKGKNSNGGRKCMFKTSREYKHFDYFKVRHIYVDMGGIG